MNALACFANPTTTLRRLSMGCGILLCIAGSCFATSAIAGKPPGFIKPTGETVATVGDHVITTDMMKAIRLASTGQTGSLSDVSDEEWSEYIQALALGAVIYDSALADDLHDDPLVRLTASITQRNVLIGEYLRRLGLRNATDEAVQAFYDEHKDRYISPRVHARHILVATREEATVVQDRLATGETFEEVAQQVSIDTGSAQNGGDLGWFERGRMVPTFEQAAFDATLGEVVGPVETQFGFHLIEALEQQDQIPLEDVHLEISAEIQQQAISTYYMGIVEITEIETVDRDLLLVE